VTRCHSERDGGRGRSEEPVDAHARSEASVDAHGRSERPVDAHGRSERPVDAHEHLEGAVDAHGRWAVQSGDGHARSEAMQAAVRGRWGDRAGVLER
jgi:hypothetical protein